MTSPLVSMEVYDLSKLREIPRLSVYGGGYFLDTAVPDTRWLIPGLIPYGVPGVLAAKGGLGKSFLALQAAIALAIGRPFLDNQAQAPMGACYLGFEDTRDTLHKRITSIIARYRKAGEWGIQEEENFRLYFTAPEINWRAKDPTTYLPGLIPEIELLLARYQERGVPPGLMVIDTLARVSEGDENTVQALRPVLNAAQRIAEAGWTPLILHHVSKGQDGARTKDKIPVADRMSPEWVRGSSAIVDNFRCLLQMTPITVTEAEGAGLDADRAQMGQYLVFGVTKLNGGKKSPWCVIEQDEAGRWAPMQDAAEILAKLRGAKAIAALSRQNALLFDLGEAFRSGLEPDKAALASAHCPDAKDPQAALRQMVHKLRAAGLVQRANLGLTVQGMERFHAVSRGNA